MSAKDWERVADAIVIWTGYDNLNVPLTSDERVVERLGQATATELLPILEELKAAFFLSDARHTATSMPDMASRSSRHFLEKYPNAPDRAVRALEWVYTWNHRRIYR